MTNAVKTEGVETACVIQAPITPVLLRLSHGVDIIDTIEAWCRNNQVEAAWINGLGAVTETRLSFYDQHTHQYHHQTFAGDYEVVNATGNVSLKEGKPFAHIHMSIGDERYQVFGGHLWPSHTKVFAFECQLWVYQPNAPLVRVPDAQTGLALWACSL